MNNVETMTRMGEESGQSEKKKLGKGNYLLKKKLAQLTPLTLFDRSFTATATELTLEFRLWSMYLYCK